MFFGILNDIKLGGTSGTALRKYGGQFANKILGRGIGGAAFLGRNIVGRGVNNSGISNTLARWNANATAKLADEKTGFLGRQLNRTIQSATNRGQKGAKGLITGSYDARSRIDKLLGAKSGLGKTLSAATGLKSGDFGDGGKGGFADRDKAKLAAKKEAEDARTKITADNLKADEKKVAETDAKFEGVTMSLGKMADVLKEVSSKSEAEQKSLKDTLDKEIKEGRTVTIAGQVFTKSSEISKIFDKSQPDSLDAVYTKEKEAAESRLEKEAKKKFEKHREAQKALGNTETLGETLNILDKLTSNTPGAFAEAAWLQQRKTLGEEAKKKAKGKVTKTEQVLSIEGELKPQANSLIKEIDQILEDSSDMQKVILNDSLKALREMEAFVPESDDKEVGKNLGKFNKDIFNKAQEAKERALKVLSQYYYNTPPANMNKADVNKKITEIAALRRKIEQSKKDYRSTLTDEEKKAAGVASKGGKKEGDGSTKDDKAATDNPKKDKPEK